MTRLYWPYHLMQTVTLVNLYSAMCFPSYLHVCHHFNLIKTSFQGCLFALKVLFLSIGWFFICFFFSGSPFNVSVGGEPSSRMTERITRHREAADITHIGSQCELSLKIPGQYYASPSLGKYYQQITQNSILEFSSRLHTALRIFDFH